MITLNQFKDYIKKDAKRYYNLYNEDVKFLEKNEEFLKECVKRRIVRDYIRMYEISNKYNSLLNSCMSKYIELSKKVIFNPDTLNKFFNTGDTTILDNEIEVYYNDVIYMYNLLYTFKNNKYKKKVYDSYNYTFKVIDTIKEFCFINNIPFDDDFRIDDRKEFDYLNIHIKVYKNDNIEFKIKA